MNPEVKIKWLEALRSGKYKQGKGCLRAGDSFCCLGVLIDVVDPEGWCADRFQGYVHKYASSNAMPNTVLRNKLELPLDLNILSGMNDRGKSFNEIADYIEARI